ncbi:MULTISPECIES: hypothetical protein [unclassified Kitasatospora]|uniref:hypothetical protein n=1 Tax=unclassified Kitasatospora TaxID=2633591 RepID=UPI0033EA1FF2
MSEQEQERPTDQVQDRQAQAQDDQAQAQDRQEQDHQGRDRDGESQKKPAAKARLVFRDPLDQQSRDDTDAGWGGRSGAGESGGRGLDWYLSQRPPHHGD